MANSLIDGPHDDDHQAPTNRSNSTQYFHQQGLSLEVRAAVREKLGIQRLESPKHATDPVRLSLQLYITLQLSRIQNLFPLRKEKETLELLYTLINHVLYLANQINDGILERRCIVWRCAMLADYNEPVLLAQNLLAAKVLREYECAESRLLAVLWQENKHAVESYRQNDGASRTLSRDTLFSLLERRVQEPYPTADSNPGGGATSRPNSATVPDTSVDELLQGLLNPTSGYTGSRAEQRNQKDNTVDKLKIGENQADDLSNSKVSETQAETSDSQNMVRSNTTHFSLPLVDSTGAILDMNVETSVDESNDNLELPIAMDGGYSRGSEGRTNEHSISTHDGQCIEQLPEISSAVQEEAILNTQQSVIDMEGRFVEGGQTYEGGKPEDQWLPVPHTPPNLRSRENASTSESISDKAQTSSQSIATSTVLPVQTSDLMIQIPGPPLSSQEQKFSEALSPEEVASRIESTSDGSKSSNVTVIKSAAPLIDTRFSDGQSGSANQKRTSSDSLNHPARSSPLSKTFLPEDIPFAKDDE